MGSIAYNSDDPIQQSFLSSLAQGETGGASYALTEGTGGQNLAGSSTDQYGFPIWQGQGNSHAAGIFQFQPGTWSSIASQYNLNFASASDQSAGAWYYAQQVYSQKTGGQSLETALQNGDFASVQSALAAVWPSVTGNQAAPQGLAANLAAGIGATLPGGTAKASGTSSIAGAAGATGNVATSSGGLSGLFVRWALLAVGLVVTVVALYLLLSSQGYVPPPSKLAKDAIAL